MSSDSNDSSNEAHVDDSPAVVGDAVPGTGDQGGAGPGLSTSGLGAMGGLDLGSMMQMAQSMQEQAALAQEQLADAEVEGTAGGGVVTVTLNGHLHLMGVHIDPSAIDADDPSMVEDLVLAAWQDAHDQVAQLQAQADPMRALLGGAGGADLLGGLGGLGGLLGGA